MSRAEIKGRMSMDAKGVRVGVDSAKKSVGGFSKQLGGLKTTMAGAFTVGAIAAFGKSIMELGGQISDFAFQTAMSTDAFQAFTSVAMDGGASMQEVRKGLISIRDAQYAALNGEQMYADAFAELGITLDDVANNSMEDLLQKVAEGAKETGNFGSVVDLVGKRNAASLEEALYVLADVGFPAMIDGAKAASEVIDSELIPKLDAAADRMDKLKLKTQTWFTIQGSKVASGLEFWGKTTKGFFGDEAGGSWNPNLRIWNSMQAASKSINDQDSKAVEKAAEGRKKNLDREQEQRTKLIEKIYAKEEEAQNKLDAKASAALVKKADALKLSGFEAADNMARIGGKIGGQSNNLEERMRQVNDHLSKIEENTTPSTAAPLTVVGG